MDNRIVFGIIVVAILLVGGYLLYSSGPVVSAQGIGELTVMPDSASVYLTVESKALNAEDAKNNHSNIMDDVLTALIKQGFERKDIQTLNYQIYPDYDYNYGGMSKLKGYVATEQIVVKTNDFDKVAKVVDAGVDAGALVQSINFELSQAKENEYKAQVLKLAAEDAKNKAEAIASGSGKHVGRLISVNSQDFNYNPWVYYANSGAATSMEVKDAAVNIQAHDTKVSATVNAQYKLGWF